MTVQRFENLRRSRFARTPFAALASLIALSTYGHFAFADACVSLPEVYDDMQMCAPTAPDLDVRVPNIVPRSNLSVTQKPSAVAHEPEPTKPAPVPLAVNTTEHGVSARTGLGSLRDYNAAMTSNKLDEAKALAPPDFSVPAFAQPPKSAVDVWSKVDAQGLDEGPARMVRAGAGADYNLSKAATAGILVERGAVSHVNPQKDQDSQKLGAYLTVKSLPYVSVDTRTEWTKTSAPSNAAQPATEKGSISVAPRINHSFALKDHKSIEPFVALKHEINVDEAGPAQGRLKSIDSALAGVTLAKPDAYSLSVTTGVDGLGGTDPATVKSQMQLKIPLR